MTTPPPAAARPASGAPPRPKVLLLPGWQDSGPGHWQTLWERHHGDGRVVQDDWHWPRRGDWMARLDEVVLDTPEPVLLAAHSLGCQLVAAWAAHSAHTARVAAALLVAPADTARGDLPPQLAGWSRIVLEPLPFPAQVIYSDDDPFCTPQRARAFAAAWGASAASAGARGHLNAASGLGDWPEARALLFALADAGPARDASAGSQ